MFLIYIFQTKTKSDFGVSQNPICLRSEPTANAIGFLLARPEGLEPPTFWFVARHSIQLSYERVCSVLFNSENYINTRAVKKQLFFNKKRHGNAECGTSPTPGKDQGYFSSEL